MNHDPNHSPQGDDDIPADPALEAAARLTAEALGETSDDLRTTLGADGRASELDELRRCGALVRQALTAEAAAAPSAELRQAVSERLDAVKLDALEPARSVPQAADTKSRPRWLPLSLAASLVFVVGTLAYVSLRPTDPQGNVAFHKVGSSSQTAGDVWFDRYSEGPYNHSSKTSNPDDELLQTMGDGLTKSSVEASLRGTIPAGRYGSMNWDIDKDMDGDEVRLPQGSLFVPMENADPNGVLFDRMSQPEEVRLPRSGLFKPQAGVAVAKVGRLGTQEPGGKVRGEARYFAGEVREDFTLQGAEKSAISPNFNTEAYDPIVENAFLTVADHPLSTFSIDVDTASYANMRRFLNSGSLPPPGAVRIEELINYFSYDYPQPDGDDPFSVNTEVVACPWNGEHRLMRIGLKGREMPKDQRPASNLVFLLDVSGSMDEPNKLPLVKEAMTMLTDQLGENDRVAIVVYAGASGLVLPSTTGDNKQAIRSALEQLQAGGSTNGASGLELAYQVAQSHFIKGGTNRVILATDGDFNVGVTNQDELVRLIERKAADGVFFTALGFGMGNYKDSTLEKLADKGNGNYAYIDTANEARKVLVEEISGTLVTIAKDVKLQLEFNPAQVASYRLIGYENRILAPEDFNDDKKDAGDVGAGHSVTALYEIVPAGSKEGEAKVDPLKYQKPTNLTPAADSKELLTLKLRYKQPDGQTSKLLEHPVTDSGKSYAQASVDTKFAAAVVSFGMLLRHSAHAGNANLNAVLELAQEGLGKDPHGYRAEFVELVKKAKMHWPPKG